MPEQSNTDEQAGKDVGEGRQAKRHGEDDVEGHYIRAARDEGIPSDEGDGRAARPYSDDDEPDVEAHRWGKA